MNLPLFSIPSQNGEEINFVMPADLFNFHISLRYFKIKFDYPTEDAIIPVTLNMSNPAFFVGANFTVQVLRLKEDRLTLSVCESFKGFYTIVLKDNDKVADLEDDPNENALIGGLMRVKKHNVLSTARLNVNCTAEAEDLKDDPSAGNYHSIFTTFWFLIVSTLFLM
jgi:hypothetical protein